MNKEIEELQEDLNECINDAQDDQLAMHMYSIGYRKQSDDIAGLNKEIERLKLVIQARDEVIIELSQEIVKLKEDREKCINALSDEYTFETTRNGVLRVFDIIRKEAVKEFVEKLKLKFDEYYNLSLAEGCIMLNDLLKEYGVEA